ncbi:MAG: hypothetical protein Q4E06_10345 [Lautropia sp.]|nr:hypothetical protein [Lautropia sp.]
MSSPVRVFTADTPPAELLAHFIPHLHIAHQIPGRVRFKLGSAAVNGIRFDAPAGKGDLFDRVLGRIRGVRHVSWNLLARSCTVEYDPGQIPDAAWPDLLAGTASPAAATLQAILEETHAQLRDAPAA